MMKRVAIFGSPGTGKSTLTKKLSELTGLPAVYLDREYFDKNKPYFMAKDETAWFERVHDLESEDEWITDGNYSGSLPARLKRADTIIFLDFPRRTAIRGVVERRIKLHNKPRHEMHSDWKERWNMEFLKYVWTYNKKSRAKRLAVLEKFKEKDILVLRSRKEVNNWLRDLEC